MVPACLLGLSLAVPVGLALGSAPASAAARPTCHGLTATIVGTAKDNRITGTPRRDVIVGLGGDDTIKGLGGDDVICGGDGADVLLGGPGDDRVESGRQGRGFDRGGVTNEPDRLEGGPGDDVLKIDADTRPLGDDGEAFSVVSFQHSRTGVRVHLGDGRTGKARGEGRDAIITREALQLIGSPKDDVLVGSPGRDTIYGGTGSDVVRGLAGDDVLSGDPYSVVKRLSAERDTVYGGDGDDQVTALTGADVLHGDAGDDKVGSYSAEPGQVFGDDGDDLVGVALAPTTGFVLDGGTGTDAASIGAVPDGSSQLPADPGPALVVRTGPGTVDRAGVVQGTVAGNESYGFDDKLQVDYYGTDAVDRVTSGIGFALRAWTYGGDDTVVGSQRDDLVDAGLGTDTVDGRLGTDTCLGAEVVTSCEKLAP